MVKGTCFDWGEAGR